MKQFQRCYKIRLARGLRETDNFRVSKLLAPAFAPCADWSAACSIFHRTGIVAAVTWWLGGSHDGAAAMPLFLFGRRSPRDEPSTKAPATARLLTPLNAGAYDETRDSER